MDKARIKSSFSPSSILPWLVLMILLAVLPSTIRGIIRTGSVYLFTRQFFRDMLARLSGPGRLRFIVQPAVAILLGSRDGMKDARVGNPPFVFGLASRKYRSQYFRGALLSLRNLISVAILLDILSQFLIFRTIHPGAALLLGPVLIGIPYSVSRAVANRISSWRNGVRLHSHSKYPRLQRSKCDR